MAKTNYITSYLNYLKLTTNTHHRVHSPAPHMTLGAPKVFSRQHNSSTARSEKFMATPEFSVGVGTNITRRTQTFWEVFLYMFTHLDIVYIFSFQDALMHAHQDILFWVFLRMMFTATKQMYPSHTRLRHGNVLRRTATCWDCTIAALVTLDRRIFQSVNVSCHQLKSNCLTTKKSHHLPNEVSTSGWKQSRACINMTHSISLIQCKEL